MNVELMEAQLRRLAADPRNRGVAMLSGRRPIVAWQLDAFGGRPKAGRAFAPRVAVVTFAGCILPLSYEALRQNVLRHADSFPEGAVLLREEVAP